MTDRWALGHWDLSGR